MLTDGCLWDIKQILPRCAIGAESKGDTIMKNGIIHYGNPIKRDGPDLTPWEAKWIWDTENITMHNWLCLRKKVALTSVPTSAVTTASVVMPRATTLYI